MRRLERLLDVHPVTGRRIGLAAAALLLATLPVVLPAGPASAAAAGSLDATFDTDGKVATDFGAANDLARDVVVQADGRIVVVGSTGSGTTGNMAVARYLANGSLDTGFDGDGKATIDFASGDDDGNAIALQPDGKIVVAGHATGATADMAVARLNADGSLDTTFDGDGRAVADFAAGADFANDVVVRPDGTIVVVGASTPAGAGTTALFAAARFNANGSFDATFDADGLVTTDVGPSSDVVQAAAVLADGRMVAAGFAAGMPTTGFDFALARYNADGSLDTSFDTDGKVTTDIAGGQDDGAYSVVLQPDGKVVAGGVKEGAPTVDFAMARYDVNGSLDPSFDSDGKVTTDIAGGNDYGRVVVLTGRGDLVLVGDTDGSPDGLSVARYTSAGALDPTFDADGKNVTDMTADNDGAYGVALQPDGKIVSVGFAGRPSSSDFAVARYLSEGDGAPPPAPPAPPAQPGYWLVASDGGIFSFGVPFVGSTGSLRLNQPIVGMAATPTGRGYWLVASDGGIFAFGDAVFFGSTGAIRLNQPIVGMAATPTGKGYWLVASDGGIFAFGDAVFRGSTGAIRLNRPVVGMSASPTGNGYWLVASDGGIFAFGDAAFFGSTGAIRLNQPVVGLAATPTGGGYRLVASDGGIFAFGDAAFFGSTGAIRLNQPIRGMESSPTGNGYWLVASDGGIFAFGDAVFKGSTGAMRLNQPVVGMAAP